MVTLELAHNVALGRYLKEPKMIWNVSVVANNHVGVDCPYPYGLITQDGTWPMTPAHIHRSWMRGRCRASIFVMAVWCMWRRGPLVMGHLRV